MTGRSVAVMPLRRSACHCGSVAAQTSSGIGLLLVIVRVLAFPVERDVFRVVQQAAQQPGRLAGEHDLYSGGVDADPVVVLVDGDGAAVEVVQGPGQAGVDTGGTAALPGGYRGAAAVCGVRSHYRPVPVSRSV